MIHGVATVGATSLPHIGLLRARVAPARFDRYLIDANGDDVLALRLYEWNIRLSSAFHETLGQFEVLLRNALDTQLQSWHRKLPGGDGRWYLDKARMPLQPKQWDQVASARRLARQGARQETHGKVVAELTFGFWRFLLDARYQPTLWAPVLRHAFPYLRPRVRKAVYDPTERLNGLRNRIAHHEPIYDLPLDDRLRELLAVAGYICPTSAAWIWSTSPVEAALASRPDL
jgi:hypothetical protein